MQKYTLRTHLDESGGETISLSQQSAESAQRLESPQPIMRMFVNNETHTMGRWNGKPLKWLILDSQPDRALLITSDGLMHSLYNSEQKPVEWEECSLRRVLLPQILSQIFDDKECSQVIRSDTQDMLFLLSIDEVIRYFPYYKARITHLNGDVAWWWLRTVGHTGDFAAGVSYDGSIISGGRYVSWGNGTVRPAFWLNLQS